MHTILLVDDEPDLVWALRYSLCAAGYDVVTAHDGETGLIKARRHLPDLLILDIAMPKLDGIQVCWHLRRDPQTAAIPILFLSIRNSIEDRIACLEQGGDAYLAKPFDLRELAAQIAAMLRRGSAVAAGLPALPADEANDDWIAVGSFALHLHNCQVRIGERIVQLTPAEFKLLHYLMKHPGKVFSSQYLLEHVWGYAPDAADPSLVRWHVKNIRAKVEPDADRPHYIRTIPRHGFLFYDTALDNTSLSTKRQANARLSQSTRLVS
jgi:DNA-binding response OmpR family regulator